MSQLPSEALDTTKPLSIGDIETSFHENDDEQAAPIEEVKKEDTKVEVKKGEDIDFKELDKEIKSVGGQGEDEVVIPVGKKTILAKYPTLFKDFPSIERAFYREQKFSEIFPSIKHAEIARERVANFDKLENDVVRNGDISSVLSSARSASPQAFNKIVNEYLPTLARVDQNAFLHVLGKVVDQLVTSLTDESTRTKNDDFKTAASIIYQHVHGTTEFKPLGKFGPEPQANAQLDAERQAFAQQRFGAVATDLNERVKNSIQAIVEENIDPKEEMTEFVKTNAVNECMKLIGQQIESDARFLSIMDNLWNRASAEGFAQASIDKIRAAYLSKARSVIQPSILKTRETALSGLGRTRKKDDEESSNTRLTPGRSTSSSNRGNGQQKDGRGMKTADFFLQED